jgi:hypothetical protein
MRRTLNRIFLAAALAGGISLAGCKQGKGERCEVASDCSGGLMCTQGFCSENPSVFDAAPPPNTGDASVPIEAAVPPGPEVAPALETAPPGPDAPPPVDLAPATPDLAPDVRPDGTTAGDGSAG